ncbi:BTAD domain-containing putative transcriptional regulator [Isoptericola sp. NPDC057559]|uniref:AfsR/SARP family transcriptional regulator n=1 Tax=Isoptericola sp. NPDC057559 TaxID=3346168 RepID=UPI003694E572
MRFEVLGPVRVTREDDVAPVSGAVRLGLLGLLLAHANAPVPAETLLDALWDTADAPDPQRLHLTVHRLRRALGEPERLVLGPGGYVLRVAPDELDAQLFDDALEQAERTQDPCRRAPLLRGALRLWRGEAYQGLDLCPLAGDAERLTERRDAACEQLYAAELDCGRHETAVADLAALVRRHPLREHLHALLMTALCRSGRQADALAVYRTVRRTLVDELGVEPGPELRDLERRILAGGDDLVPRVHAAGSRPVTPVH